jgi:hypothetical protein
MDAAREPADYFPDHLLDSPGAAPFGAEKGDSPHLCDDRRCASVPAFGPFRQMGTVPFFRLAGLLLFCLAMQLWMASRWHVMWPDTVDYLRVSQALERGDPRPLVDQFGLNVYPLILVLLHRAGLDWLWAGQCWSIALTSLTVLPLFGWLRRQFDQRVAVVGCLLYAVHPKLMIYGSLVIRDPTFWFLLILTLYLGWRAVVELKPWLFLAAGIAWALAVHTRDEGLLLAAPLGVWWFIRWLAVAGQRRRLVLWGLLGAAMLPAWILLMNLTLLHGDPHWVLFRRSHVEMLQGSPAEPARPLPPDSPQEPPGPPGKAGSGLGAAGVDAVKVAVRVVKAFTYAYGFLVLLGLWLWRRVFFRRDQLAMLPFHLALWSLIGVYFAQSLESDERYFLPSVIVTSGCAALGLLAIARRLMVWTAPRVAWSPPRRALMVAGLLAAFVLIGTHDRSLEKRKWLAQRADLGTWIRQRFGPRQRLAGEVREMRLLAYCAEADVVPCFDRYSYRGANLPWALGQLQPAPDVLVLWAREGDRENPPQWQTLLRGHAEWGFCLVPPPLLPASCQEVDGKGEPPLVAVRKGLLERLSKESPAPSASHH